MEKTKRFYIINDRKTVCMEVEYVYTTAALSREMPIFFIEKAVITKAFEDSMPTTYERRLLEYIQNMICDKDVIMEASDTERRITIGLYSQALLEEDYNDSLLTTCRHVLRSQAFRLSMDEKDYTVVSDYEYRQLKLQEINNIKNNETEEDDVKEYGMKELVEVLKSIDESLKTIAQRANDFYTYK